MGEATKIQWTDHTFNIAWGCTKISAGCTNCYADAQSHRYGFDVWGPKAERRTFGDKHWREPIKWNAAAQRDGVRRRVFCSSMCDVFEDHPTIDAERARLWPLIAATPWLDWQILTKRAERMRELAPRMPLPNVWFGVSVEDQATYDARWQRLAQTPAAVRFISLEPMLAPVDLCLNIWTAGTGPDWVIVGCESGPGARACDVGWIRSAVEQCKAAGVAVFVKQLGAAPYAKRGDVYDLLATTPVEITGGPENPLRLRDRKGGDPSEWPYDLRVREFPKEVPHD